MFLTCGTSESAGEQEGWTGCLDPVPGMSRRPTVSVNYVAHVCEDGAVECHLLEPVLVIRAGIFPRYSVRSSPSLLRILRSSFRPFRCLLGFAQGGFIPDVVLYLSYYYKTKERRSQLSCRYQFCLTSSCSPHPPGLVLGVELRRVHRWSFHGNGAAPATRY